MPLTITVSRGYTATDSTPISVADLNAGFLPTVQISGSVGASDLDAGAVNTTHVVPGPFFTATAAGTANAITVALSPAPTSLAAGLWFSFKAAATNTGAATLSVNGLTATAIKKLVDQDLEAGDIRAGQEVWVQYDGTYFQLVSVAGLPRKVYGTLGGSVNTYTLTLADVVINATSDLTGRVLHVKVNVANTGASTLNVNGKGAVAIKKPDGTDPAAGDLAANRVYAVVFDGTQYQLLGSTGAATLPDVVAAATVAYPASITFDAKGRVTAATSGSAALALTKKGPATFPSAGSKATLAHGLGAAPKVARWVLVCTTGDLGYSAGDEIDATSVFSAAAAALFTYWSDGTNVNLAFATGATAQAVNKSTFAAGALTTANWALYCYVG
jgi:hypothetical protein